MEVDATKKSGKYDRAKNHEWYRDNCESLARG